MIGDVAVRVEHLSKRFKLYSNAWARLADWLHLPPGPRHREFWALRDVSWQLRRGECLGIIGPNGAGKSTLLKLLTGALYPTSGAVEVSGRVLSLLELGTGFNGDLTGRQNVEQSARLLGFQPGYAAMHVSEIQAFAELGEFFDRPVKFYSSGMLVRLSFSLFSTMQPDVFLVDEALAVGDLRFGGKALGRIREMLDAGTTLLFVSHDLQLINRICSRALWLHGGTLQMDGDPAKVTRAYQQFVVHGGVQASFDDEPEAETDTEAAAELPLATPEIVLGSGWLGLEAFAGEVFRWAEGDAEILVNHRDGLGHELVLDLQPGPSAGPLPVQILVTDGHGAVRANVALERRELVHVPIAFSDSGAELERLVIRPVGPTQPNASDSRQLVLRAFGWSWSDQPAQRSIQRAGEAQGAARDLDLISEFARMEDAFHRCPHVPGRAARFTRIVTRNVQGQDAVRFATHDLLVLQLTMQALAEVRGLMVGVQVRDAFDRMISGTRTDWQRVSLPPLKLDQEMTIEFICPDMLLGPGLYQLTVAVSEDGREDHVAHWVDGAWRFEMVSPTSAPVVGLVDLGWRFQGAAVHDRVDVQTVLSVRSG